MAIQLLGHKQDRRGTPNKHLPLAAFVILVACSGSVAPGPSSAGRALAGDPAGSCRWPGVAPEREDVTYIVERMLVAVDPHEPKPVCLLEIDGASHPSLVSWGPRAERVLLAPNDAVLPSGKRISPHEAASTAVWSRPEGKSVLGITDGRITKRRTIEDQAVDITFLKRHHEAIYHPAGTHIISIGIDDKDAYGVFMATNVGEEVKQLAIAEDAGKIYSLTAAANGITVYFAADHGSYREIHSLGLEDGELGTVHSTAAQVAGIGHPFETEHETVIAVQVGACSEDTTVTLVGVVEGRPQPLIAPAGSSSQPIGWLADGSLVVLVRRQGCGGTGDLYLVSPVLKDGESLVRRTELALIKRGVVAAGVRRVAPPAPLPPGSPVDPPAA